MAGIIYCCSMRYTFMLHFKKGLKNTWSTSRINIIRGTYMILCSLLDRFNITLHLNNLQKKYVNLNVKGSQLVLVQFQNNTLFQHMHSTYIFIRRNISIRMMWNVGIVIVSSFCNMQYNLLYAPSVSQALQVRGWGIWPRGWHQEI